MHTCTLTSCQHSMLLLYILFLCSVSIVTAVEAESDDIVSDAGDIVQHEHQDDHVHDSHLYEVHDEHAERPERYRSYNGLVPSHIMNNSLARTHFMCQMDAFKQSAVARTMRLNIPQEWKFVILQSTSWGEENVKIKMSSAYIFNRRAWSLFHKHVFRIRKMDSIFKNKYMAKPYLMRDELIFQLKYSRKNSIVFASRNRPEWIVWFDMDTWINPLNPPDLHSLVAKVPSEKMLLVTQQEHLNTGVVFIRVHRDSIAIVDRWIEILESDLIQCHPWDQAGLQWLFAERFGGFNASETPCVPPKCGAVHQPEVEEYWSCTPLFEYAVETTFGHNRFIELGLWNNVSGDVGILMDPSPSVKLHCWGCFSPLICDDLARFRKLYLSDYFDNYNKKECVERSKLTYSRTRDIPQISKPRLDLAADTIDRYPLVLLDYDAHPDASDFQINHGQDSNWEFDRLFLSCSNHSVPH
eukprot:m.586797 g.586797  ORF g.586797 m.586797 type:complete len:468 (+) comp22347_c0_seq10:322-1725(+)